MFEIYILLHIDSDRYHKKQNRWVKGYHKYQFFLSSKIRRQKLTNSKSLTYIFYAAIFIFIINSILLRRVIYAITLYISTMINTLINGKIQQDNYLYVFAYLMSYGLQLY